MRTAEIAVQRMRHQRLWGPPMKTAEDVVRHLGAMQAQEFVPAKWSVAQRTSSVDDAAMDKALDDGTILRTHLLRPTWHFVLPADIRWLLQVVAPRVHALNAYQYRSLGLDDDAVAVTNRLLAQALAGGVQLTRQEIGAHLDRHGVTAEGLRLAYILMRAELDAVVVSGASRGKQRTYACFDDRVPAAEPVSREDALGRLTRRYFESRGPATLKDYARWCSLTSAEAGAGLEMVRSRLQQVHVEGRTYWQSADAPPDAATAPTVDLVQGFDECIMSYSESRDVLRPACLPPADPGAAPYLHAILLDGQLIGHWKHTLKRREVVVDTFFYRRPHTAEASAMDHAVHRLSTYFGVDARWR